MTRYILIAVTSIVIASTTTVEARRPIRRVLCQRNHYTQTTYSPVCSTSPVYCYTPSDPVADTSAPPYHGFRTWGAVFALRRKAGEAHYVWPKPHNATGDVWNTTLVYQGMDRSRRYHVYYEKEYPDYKWAFARYPMHDGYFRIYFWPNGEVPGRKWQLYGCGEKFKVGAPTKLESDSRRGGVRPTPKNAN